MRNWGPVKEAAMTPNTVHGENARPLTAAGRDTSDGSNIEESFRARERPTLAIVGKHLGSSAVWSLSRPVSGNLAQPQSPQS